MFVVCAFWLSKIEKPPEPTRAELLMLDMDKVWAFLEKASGPATELAAAAAATGD